MDTMDQLIVYVALEVMLKLWLVLGLIELSEFGRKTLVRVMVLIMHVYI
jgi:hypothetical protein